MIEYMLAEFWVKLKSLRICLENIGQRCTHYILYTNVQQFLHIRFLLIHIQLSLQCNAGQQCLHIINPQQSILCTYSVLTLLHNNSISNLCYVQYSIFQHNSKNISESYLEQILHQTHTHSLLRGGFCAHFRL